MPVKVVMDSSALAKRYVEERGSGDVEQILMATSELGLCIVCIPEVLSALNRLCREKILSAADYQRAKTVLLADMRDATILNLTPSVISIAVGLLEKNMLRAMDALHVACAIEWRIDLFVSSDNRLLAAAEKAGLKSRFVG